MSLESEFEKFEEFERFEEEGGLVHELDHSGNRTGRNISKAQHAQHTQPIGTGTVPVASPPQAVVTGVATTNPAQPPVVTPPTPTPVPFTPVPGQPPVAANPSGAPNPYPASTGTDPRAYGQG